MKIRSIILITLIYAISPGQQSKSPYRLNKSLDGLIAGSAAMISITAFSIDRNIPSLSASEISTLNSNQINIIDRVNAGVYSKNQSTVSDLLVGGSILSPFLFVFDENIRNDINTVSTMYLETVIFANFLPSIGKGGVRRIRPYVYGSDASLSEKMDVDARRSFFSGHATWAFASSIFFATVYSDYYPDSEFKNYIWGGAIGFASTISILRVTSGHHFISDVVTGGFVGSIIGYGIPYLHRSNSSNLSFYPSLSHDFSGITLTYHLK